MISEADYSFIIEFDKLKEAPKERNIYIKNSKLEVHSVALWYLDTNIKNTVRRLDKF